MTYISKTICNLVLPMNNKFTDYMKVRLIEKEDIISQEAKQIFLQEDYKDIG